MEKKFRIVFGGFEIHAGGKPLADGTYQPTLAVKFGPEDAPTLLDLPVPGAGAYVTISDAQERAFEEGGRWVKARS